MFLPTPVGGASIEWVKEYDSLKKQYIISFTHRKYGYTSILHYVLNSVYTCKFLLPRFPCYTCMYIQYMTEAEKVHNTLQRAKQFQSIYLQ